ncbi:hypothetical protein BJ742DRAFT_765493 [Cladochytrium replicatum]|nr:hypothetical protein BJ742DRAFT_765493 [Cladochytrium replicatum]
MEAGNYPKKATPNFTEIEDVHRVCSIIVAGEDQGIAGIDASIYKKKVSLLSHSRSVRTSLIQCITVWGVDGFMFGQETTLARFRAHVKGDDVCIIEGVMGLFDGHDGLPDVAYTVEVAKFLDSPVLLVVDCWSICRSVGAVARRFRDFDPALKIAGVICNKTAAPAVAKQKKVRIAVAKDEAFCFYYQDNMHLLSTEGAEVVYFSPMRGQKLPENVQGLYVVLEVNKSMLNSIREFAKSGGAIFAECGGMMYLSQNIWDAPSR